MWSLLLHYNLSLLRAEMWFLLLNCFAAVLGTNMHSVNICCLHECNMFLCEKLELKNICTL